MVGGPVKGYLTCTLGNPMPPDYAVGKTIVLNDQMYKIVKISDDRRTVRLSGNRAVMGKLEVDGR
jgi:hypothetical protein